MTVTKYEVVPPKFTAWAEGGTPKTCQHSRSPGDDLKPEPPEQETKVLTIRRQRPVLFFS